MTDKNAISPSVDAPIPGQSLTAPLGDRPWQRPPRYNTVEQALEFYMPRLTSERQSGQMIDLLEMGVPVDTMVDAIQLGGVMEGLHSVDVGILLSPVLAETVVQMAKSVGVEPVLTGKSPEEVVPDAAETQMAIRESMMPAEVEEEEVVMQEEQQPVEEQKGLMARRINDGI
jgi:hypothetical protein